MAKISGNISDNARLIIVKESDWSVESNTTKTGGAFEVDGLASGAKTVISRATSGECTGYGNVTAVEPPPPAEPDPILHTARFFSTYNDGYLVGWGSSFSAARSLTTAGEINDNYANWNEAVRASKTGFGGAYDYMVTRSFFYFDLSDFSTSGRTVQDVNVTFKNRDYRASSVSIVEGTQSTPLAVEDFDAVGSTELATRLSWSVVDEYIANWKTFALNSTGKTYVGSKIGDVAKFCLRESTHDFDNAAPTAEKRNGLYFSEESSPDLLWSPHHYYPGRPYMEISYMKVPVWSSKIDNTFWEPFDENSDNGTWNGTAWVAGRWNSLDIQVKTGSTWAVDYKPLKIRVTGTGWSTDTYVAVYGTNGTWLIFDPWEYSIFYPDGLFDVEIPLDWFYPNEQITEIYFDEAVTVTNIEFLER